MLVYLHYVNNNLFSTFAKFWEKFTVHTPWYVHVRVRNVSFSENFADVPNELPLKRWYLVEFSLHFKCMLENIQCHN